MAEQNVTNERTYEILSKDVGVIYIAVSSTIIVFGIFLNGLVIVSYLTKALERTHFNFCLVNLSVASIGEHVGFCPYVALDALKDKITWESGITEKLLCGITNGITLFFISVCVNAFLVVYMSILRYRMITKVERRNKIPRRSKVIFFMCWVVSVAMATPNMLTMAYNKRERLCIRTYNIISKKSIMIWGGLMVLVVYIVPMMVILFTHCCISLEMCKATNNQFKSHVKVRYRNKVVTCLGITVAIFLILWTPWASYWALRSFDYFGTDIAANYEKERIVKWVLLPSLSVGVFNVITYGIVNVKVRRSLLNVLGRKEQKNTVVAVGVQTRDNYNVSSTELTIV